MENSRSEPNTLKFLDGLPSWFANCVHLAGDGRYDVYDEAGLLYRSVNTPAEVYAAVLNISDGLDGTHILKDIDTLVSDSAAKMREKLMRSELKYGRKGCWRMGDWHQKLREDLVQHVFKGDPVDVMIYCAFASHHGWSIEPKGHHAPWGRVNVNGVVDQFEAKRKATARHLKVLEDARELLASDPNAGPAGLGMIVMIDDAIEEMESEINTPLSIEYILDRPVESIDIQAVVAR